MVTYTEAAEQKWESMQAANCVDPDYLICEFKEKELMDVHSTGKGGITAVRDHLEKDFADKVCTGVFFVTAVDDRSTTVSLRKKIVQFTWVGPNTPVMKRARVVSQSGSFVQFFSGATVYLQPSELDEISEVEVEKKLRSCGGAHQPTSFDFENVHSRGASGSVSSKTTAKAEAEKEEEEKEETADVEEAVEAVAAVEIADVQVEAEEEKGDADADVDAAGEAETEVPAETPAVEAEAESQEATEAPAETEE